MFTLRRGADRGSADYGWLAARYSFSFGDYFDPARLNYRALRVLNEDRVAPGGGFPTHGHRDMEILTTVLSGALEHRDSLGNGEVIRPGEWQAMTAGTGVRHSEFNPSATDPTHLLQIWLVPDRAGHAPGYRQRAFAAGPGWRLVASPDGANDTLPIHQDARVYEARLTAGEAVRHEAGAGRGLYLHVATGAVTANGHALTVGDAATVEGEPLAVTATGPATLVLFDLA